MKKDNIEINITALRHKFSGRKKASKKELREFYQRLYPELSEQGFRRILYSLENERYIGASGSGIYVFQSHFSSQFPNKKKFLPRISPLVGEVNDEVMEAYPYLNYVIWETKILFDFMVQQPWQNEVLVEVEKETEESVFNGLTEKYPGRVFLDPDREVMERYVFQQTDPILVTGLVSQTPKGKKVGGVPYAKLEKILVDILIDDEKFFIFPERELVSIYENIFSRYLIDEKSFLRYAGRRNGIQKLKEFLNNQTKIRLFPINEDEG